MMDIDKDIDMDIEDTEPDDFTAEHDEMSFDTPDESFDSTEHEVDKVNSNNVMLNLSCEIGSVSLSLAEVMQLSTKSVLEIGSLPPTVRLNLNGRIIATGVLVEIKDRLGLKLTNIYNG